MANIELKANYLERHFAENGIELDVIRQDILAISVAKNAGSKPEQQLAKELNLTLPNDALTFTSDKTNKTRLIPVAVGQYFILASQGDKSIAERLGSLDPALYVTEQSDAWVVVRMVGQRITDVLERTSPVDMSEDVFKVSQFVRTSAEHMALIVLRVSDDEYWFMSASSSALSFLHALEQSISNIDV